jgi:hypothetical protein
VNCVFCKSPISYGGLSVAGNAAAFIAAFAAKKSINALLAMHFLQGWVPQG